MPGAASVADPRSVLGLSWEHFLVMLLNLTSTGCLLHSKGEGGLLSFQAWEGKQNRRLTESISNSEE